MSDNKTSPTASRRIPIAIVLGLTLFSGVVHGYLDGRWSVAESLTQQGALLKQIPDQCGDWELAGTSELADNAAELLRCYGDTNRVYRNRITDQQITVAIMFGPRGPIAVHTPEVCYDSVGTKQSRDRMVETISSAEHRDQLWSVQFSKTGDSEASFEVWYAWSTGDSWQAAEHPRFWMTESLYKIQLAGPVGQGDDQPVREFLTEFLPQVDEVLR